MDGSSQAYQSGPDDSGELTSRTRTAGSGRGQQHRRSDLPQSRSTGGAGGAGGRKKGTACLRCRSQKSRCDDNRPSCGNCAKAGHVCVRSAPNNPDAAQHITQLETRIRSLEETIRRVASDDLDRLDAAPLETSGYPAPAVRRPSSVASASSPQVTALSHQGGVSSRPGSEPWADRAGGPFPTPSTSRVPDTSHSHSRRPSPLGDRDDPARASPATQIRPSEPLAHEVGLLSLANFNEPKYLGPSSGVPFARLIFSALPQSQGLTTDRLAAHPRAPLRSQPQPFPRDWVFEDDCQHFVDAYLETFQPQYPFLDEDFLLDRLEIFFAKHSPTLDSSQLPQLGEAEASLSPFHAVHLLLVIALGARVLEYRLASDFSSDRYLATAMQRIGALALHDSIEGLQIMLLLILSSFRFQSGPNAWFLVSNAIASCLDLGLHRRLPIDRPPTSLDTIKYHEVRRGIFWSTYSLERTVSVVLGRPHTLRDEAIDIEFPGLGHMHHVKQNADKPGHVNASKTDLLDTTLDGNEDPYSHKKARLATSPYVVAQYSYRFDQIIAETKLTLHRVVNLPSQFPWPVDIPGRQKEMHRSLERLFEGLTRDLKSRSRRSKADTSFRKMELKYHHCLMILHRPSPAIPRPSLESWRVCYDSAVKTILIHSDLHRFAKLANTWLTAHTVFVSGITFLYCLWVRPEIKNEATLAGFKKNAAACSALLRFLGKTWSVAADAVDKYERLVQMTVDSWQVIGVVRQNVPEEYTSPDDSTVEVAAGHSLLSMARPDYSRDGENERGIAGQLPQPQNALDEQAPLSGLLAGEGAGGLDFDPGLFYNELGDMSTWFDLNWLGMSGETTSPPSYSYY